jgi:tetratricopeptide (TPR) repeat protein
MIKGPGPSQEDRNDLLKLLQNGQTLEAANSAMALTQKYPKNQFVWKVLGAANDKLSKREEALFANQKALELAPEDFEAHNNLGVSLKNLGRFQEAVNSFKKAISINPNFPNAFFNLGVVLNSIGKPNDAIKCFHKATLLNPNYVKAYNNLGLCLANTGSLTEAEKCFRKAILLNPQFFLAHNNLGNVLKDQNRLEESLISYKNAIAISSNYAEAYYNMGSSLKELGRLEASVTSYTKAISLKPNYGNALNNLALVFEELNIFDKAEKLYRLAISSDPGNFNAINNLGNTLKSMGQIDEAKSCFNKAIDTNPDFVNPYYNLTSIKTFKDRDRHFARMNELYLNQNLTENESCLINFALAKANEDLQYFEQAFLHYSKGNKLRRKILNYDFKNDITLFDQIKSNSKLIFEHSLNVNDLEVSLIPVFIVGMPRSGTTLVEQIISSHSKVTGAGELLFIDSLGAKIAKGISKISKPSLLDFRKKYLDKLKKISKGNVIVTDKLPQNFRFIGLISSAFPEARIIHVQRNPAAVCWANFKQYFSQLGLGYTYSLKDVVGYYNLYKDLMKYWIKMLGQRIYNLDYEALVEDQENQTRQLIKYLDLEWDHKCLAPQENKKNVSTASSVQVRKKVYKGSSKQWLKFKPFLNGAFDEFL